MKNITISTFLILLFAVIGLSQLGVKQSSIEDGWKGIKPLKTNKVEVSKLLGTPEIDDNDYHNYRTDEAFVRVNYSTAPCQKSDFGRGKFNIPKEIVLDYVVHIKELVKLSEFKFEREKYIKDTSGDVENNVLYVNEREGIIISVHIQEGTEYAGTIYFRPKPKLAETLKCTEIKSENTKKNSLTNALFGTIKKRVINDPF